MVDNLEKQVRKIFVKHSMEKDEDLELFDTDAIIRDAAKFIEAECRKAELRGGNV